MSMFPTGGLFGQGAFQIDQNSTPEMIRAKRAQIAALLPQFGKAHYVGEGIGQLATGIATGMKNRKLDKFEGDRRAEAAALFNKTLAPKPGGLSILGTMPATQQPGPDKQIANEAMAALGKQTAAPDDRMLLAKTLMAEAGGEGLEGMLAAGAVINNRVGAGGYGSNLREVIMKPGQFSAWNGVTGYAGGEGALDMDRMTPNEQALQAADMLLSGQYQDPTGGENHYYNPSVADPKWGQRNGGDWLRIGNHIFGSADAGRGGQQRAPATQPAQSDPALNDLMMMAQNPWLSAEQRAVINNMISAQQSQQQAMAQQQMRRDDMVFQQDLKRSDPANQIALQKSQIELEQMRNPQPGFRVLSPEEAQGMGLPAGAYQVGPDGKVGQIGKGGRDRQQQHGQPNAGPVKIGRWA